MKTSNDFKLIRKNDYEKLIISCWVMLIAIWIFVAISGNYLTIVVDNQKVIEICSFIDNNFILSNLCRFITYYLNWIFIIYGILQKKIFSYKPVIITSSIFILWLIKTIFINIPIVNYIDFLAFGILAILLKKKWYRAIIGCIFVFAFSFISSFVKNLFIPTEAAGMNVYSLLGLVFMVDYILMSIIYYLTILKRKEFKTNEKHCNNGKQLGNFLQIKQKVENYFLRIGNSVSNFFRCNRSIASIRSKTYDLYCGLVFTILTYLSLLIVGIIFDRWIEMTVSVVFFHIFRGSDEETYHANHDFKCWCVSMFNFIVIMRLTLPLHISYITSIALSFVLCMIMRLVYKIKRLVTKSNHTTKRRQLIDIIGEQNINEDYIENLCIMHGLPNKYAETIYLYLNNTLEETALILDTDNSTITRRINRFIKELYIL